MLEFELQRCTRKCAKTDRELQPGEPIVSVLIDENPQVRRVDFAQSAWDEPPANAIAWWKSQIPGGAGKRTQWAPHEVMLDYFQRLAEDESKLDVRYVLALLMVRRRVVRLEQSEFDEAGREILVLYCARHETEYRVPVAMPSAARAAEIQLELSQLLV